MSADRYRLTPEQLHRRCEEDRFNFETTADLPATREIIGQPRGVRAIEFGIDMKSDGYNIYVLGPTGTGRLTAVERFIRDRARQNPTPDDWLYVYNFGAPHQPNAMHLPPGMGDRLRADMKALVNYLREQIPQAFESQTYQEAAKLIHQSFEDKRDAAYRRLREQAAEKGLAIVQATGGLMTVPVVEGKLMDPDVFEALPVEERDVIEKSQREIEEQLEDALVAVRRAEIEMQGRLDDLAQQNAAVTVDARMDALKEKWQDYPEVLAYLDDVRADVIENVDDFRGDEKADDKAPRDGHDPLWRYGVNVIVDHKDGGGAPVVVVNQPTFRQLVGRVEYRTQYGALQTDFTMIKAGALHRANGGYLVVRAIDVFRQPYTWEALKQALTAGEIRIETLDGQDSTPYAPQAPEPEPIPLKVKVVLLGSPWLYYTLYDDDDFPELFKVKSDFATEMDRTPENEDQYALFIAARCCEGDLPHFDRSAVARVIEHGARMADSQRKLSTRFGVIADLVHEAAYWARRSDRDVVTGADVVRSLHEWEYRHNLDAEDVYRRITEDKTLFIDVDGEAVGQVNSLGIVGTPDYQFGQPGRLTAQVYLGRDGLVQIDREVNLTGPIHNKGLLTIKAFMSAKYARDRHLTLSASLSFEQNYGHIEGDSASSTELYALISAIAQIPIKQGVAVTGSVNQLGYVQPIGGVNEKVEGYFEVCRAYGLNGRQGVLIPSSNLNDLMLRDEIIEAVAAGTFHLWAVETIDQGLEVLTGMPAGELQEDGVYPEGTVNRAVVDRLCELDEKDKQADGRDDEDEDDSSSPSDAGDDKDKDRPVDVILTGDEPKEGETEDADGAAGDPEAGATGSPEKDKHKNKKKSKKDRKGKKNKKKAKCA
ncbi:MAG: AAA family ATPase [Anaerolineae bacterium]|nr:AAA family ATPase [Anaerolineae bacterium]